MVKLEIGRSMPSTGFMYWLMAESISQLLGLDPLVNNENVRWYVGALRRERVLRFVRASVTSGLRGCGLWSADVVDVDRRYDMMACSSAKVDRSCVATNPASEDEEDAADGTEFGGYVMSRIGE